MYNIIESSYLILVKKDKIKEDETMAQYIVVGVLALMIVCFLIGKWSYGFIMMVACTILAATGAVSIGEAFSGFCDKNMIMMAGIFIISRAFSKTSLIGKIKKSVSRMQSGKSSAILLLLIVALVVVFGQFLPAAGSMSVIIMLIGVLSADGGDVCASRMLFPIALLSNFWTSKLPIGMGATAASRMNAFIEAYDPSYAVGIADPFKAAILPLIALTLYTVFAYKMFPKREIDSSKLRDMKEQAAIPKRDEILIYIVFVAVMVAIFLNSQLGDITYLSPAIGVAILVITKAFTFEEARSVLSGDDIFLIAGSFGVSTALSVTGAGELVGTIILSLLGGNPSELTIMIVFTLITTIMANLMNRTAIYSVVVPLAVTTAFTAGYDPGPLALAVAGCTYLNALLPSCAPSIGIAIASGKYSMKEVVRYGLPYVLIGWITTVIDVMIFF